MVPGDLRPSFRECRIHRTPSGRTVIISAQGICYMLRARLIECLYGYMYSADVVTLSGAGEAVPLPIPVAVAIKVLSKVRRLRRVRAARASPVTTPPRPPRSATSPTAGP